jgi:RNA polymerase sigma-70 factor (ECF subfamily)
VRDHSDQDAWREFVARYRDLILRYCQWHGLQSTDAEDVHQSVMTRLGQALRTFDYSRKRGKFRNYLGKITRNEIIRYLNHTDRIVAVENMERLSTPETGDSHPVEPWWEREWLLHHLRLAMHHVRASCDSRSMAMFQRLLAGDSVEKVACAFETSSQAVHKMKQRMRDRLKDRVAMQIQDEEQT